MAMHIRQPFDLSEELIIQRCGSGVQLIRPTLTTNHSLLSIKTAHSLPVNVYFLGGDSTIFHINDSCLEFLGVDASKQAINNTISKFIPANDAKVILENDNLVVHNQLMSVFAESSHAEENPCSFISFKMPLFEDHKVVGIFGFSFNIDLINPQHLVPTLSRIIQSNLLSANEMNVALIPQTRDRVIYSPREQDVLMWLVRGKTAKEIAGMLNLSRRTVEHHIASAKTKAQVNTKSQLIEKVYYLFVA